MPNQSGVWTLSQQFQGRGQGLWPAAPGAPTIGAASAGTGLCASVTFTAPACAGYPPITSYTATSTPGCISVSGASSPIVVTGLTGGTSYTFKVKATNPTGSSPFSASSNSITAVAPFGCQSFTSSGTYTWVAPSGVTSVSVVAVGGGGAGDGWGGGGGGGLGWKNNISVTPGASYTVQVGSGGNKPGGSSATFSGANSFFNSYATVGGGGGSGAGSQIGGNGGSYSGCGGGSGGRGGNLCYYYGGGGGAGGYTGSGGAGGVGSCGYGSPGTGGGGGGAASGGGSGGGGGVGLMGLGANGNGGTFTGSWPGAAGGGSGGSNGSSVLNGGAYGGGGGSGNPVNSSTGAVGAVRIVWPGNTRSFPSTNV